MNDNPLIDGSLKSPTMTETQKSIKDILTYFTKIGITVSLEEAVVRVEQPNGFENFIDELEKVRTEDSFVNRDKYLELEDKFRYETLRRPLGNSTSAINLFFRYLSSRPEFNELMEKGVAEAMMISKQGADFSKATGKTDTDLL